MNNSPTYQYEMLSWDILLEYAEGKLDKAQMQEVEAYLTANPEEKEALEGIILLQKNKANNAEIKDFLLPSNQERDELIQKSKPFLPKQNKPLGIIKRLLISPYFIGVAAAVVGLLMIISLFKPATPKGQIIAMDVSKNSVSSNERKTFANLAKKSSIVHNWNSKIGMDSELPEFKKPKIILDWRNQEMLRSKTLPLNIINDDFGNQIYFSAIQASDMNNGISERDREEILEELISQPIVCGIYQQEQGYSFVQRSYAHPISSYISPNICYSCLPEITNLDYSVIAGNNIGMSWGSENVNSYVFEIIEASICNHCSFSNLYEVGHFDYYGVEFIQEDMSFAFHYAPTPILPDYLEWRKSTSPDSKHGLVLRINGRDLLKEDFYREILDRLSRLGW